MQNCTLHDNKNDGLSVTISPRTVETGNLIIHYASTKDKLHIKNSARTCQEPVLNNKIPSGENRSKIARGKCTSA